MKLLEDSDNGAVQVSDKTKAFWEIKRIAADSFIEVFEEAEKSAVELSNESRQKREVYFQSAAAGWNGLKDVLNTLHQEIIGPYALGMCLMTWTSRTTVSDVCSCAGDQLSIADLHLAAWLARIAFLSGAVASDDGNTAVGKIELHIGGGFSLPKDFTVAEARRRAGLAATNLDSTERQNKLAAFWDVMKERPSWKKVYANGLH